MTPANTARDDRATPESTTATRRVWRERPRWQRIALSTTAGFSAVALVASPWWGPPALSHLDFFHVRTVEFEGVRFAKVPELVARLQMDTSQSVWQSLDSLEARVAAHPMVQSVIVDRDLPGTMRVRIVEREPVALVPSKRGLRPVDVTGAVLPIDPSINPIDLPVVAGPDSALLAVVDALRRNAPTLYRRISEAARTKTGDLRFAISGSKVGAAGPSMGNTVIVRSNPDVTPARFRDILRVEANLAQNHLRAVELDLRFRDQVIARQP